MHLLLLQHGVGVHGPVRGPRLLLRGSIDWVGERRVGWLWERAGAREGGGRTNIVLSCLPDWPHERCREESYGSLSTHLWSRRDYWSTRMRLCHQRRAHRPSATAPRRQARARRCEGKTQRPSGGELREGVAAHQQLRAMLVVGRPPTTLPPPTRPPTQKTSRPDVR